MKIPPVILKDMAATAEKMPPIHYTTLETVRVKGSDLLLTDVKEVDGNLIEEEKEYFMKVPAHYPINHLRRMKKIYLRFAQNEGIDFACGKIRQYIEDMCNLYKNAQKQ